MNASLMFSVLDGLLMLSPPTSSRHTLIWLNLLIFLHYSSSIWENRGDTHSSWKNCSMLSSKLMEEQTLRKLEAKGESYQLTSIHWILNLSRLCICEDKENRYETQKLPSRHWQSTCWAQTNIRIVKCSFGIILMKPWCSKLLLHRVKMPAPKVMIIFISIIFISVRVGREESKEI